MNKDRRTRIASVLEGLRELSEEVSSLAGEERDAFDNLPESLQNSDRGSEMDQFATSLEEAESSIGAAIEELESIE